MSDVQNEDDLDRTLNQLAKEAQGYPDRSYERRRLLNQLVQKILQSGTLVHPKHELLPLAVSEDLYHEALNITLMEICKKVDKYDLNKDILAWVNFVLNKRFIDICRKEQDIRKYLDKNWKPIDLEILEHRATESVDSSSPLDDLKELIEEDPNQIFTNKYVKGHPNATFQFLALARIWEDRKWKEISNELNVPTATLCEFFKKQLKELTPYFKEYLLN
jgi:DNA-directed RNA polymerase specialized sigma24 family protein